jgi:hypothetical protein
MTVVLEDGRTGQGEGVLISNIPFIVSGCMSHSKKYVPFSIGAVK